MNNPVIRDVNEIQRRLDDLISQGLASDLLDPLFQERARKCEHCTFSYKIDYVYYVFFIFKFDFCFFLKKHERERWAVREEI